MKLEGVLNIYLLFSTQIIIKMMKRNKIEGHLGQ